MTEQASLEKLPVEIGVIAGNRSLPFLFVNQARALGAKRIVAVAFRGETNPDLENLVDKIVWIRVGQLTKMIAAFTDRGITQCVMVGQIAPSNLFHLRPDFKAIALLSRLKEKNAHTIFGGIADELKKEKVDLVSAIPWLEPLMPGPGYHLGPDLNQVDKDNLVFGYKIAKASSKLEIGQVVVVKNGTVLAVEAFEGTDPCLLRGGGLAGKEGKACAVKVAKENHDLRFDIPCIGPGTIETCVKAKISLIGLEAGKTLLLEQDCIIPMLRKHRISIVTIT